MSIIILDVGRDAPKWTFGYRLSTERFSLFCSFIDFATFSLLNKLNSLSVFVKRIKEKTVTQLQLYKYF